MPSASNKKKSLSVSRSSLLFSCPPPFPFSLSSTSSSMSNVPAGCMPTGQTSQKDRVQSGLFSEHCSFIITLIVGRAERAGFQHQSETDQQFAKSRDETLLLFRLVEHSSTACHFSATVGAGRKLILIQCDTVRLTDYNGLLLIEAVFVCVWCIKNIIRQHFSLME